MAPDPVLGEVAVHESGSVPPDARSYASEKIGHVAKLARGPVLFAKVDLIARGDPARELHALAKAELDIDGTVVRAHGEASTMLAAIDELEGRLRERVERAGDVERARHLRHRDPRPWRHGDPPTHRTHSFPRPVDERQIVRHKTFALHPLTPDEAALELEQLDHDFWLFNNAETADDNVIARAPDGGYELLEPPAGDRPARSGDGPIRVSAVHPGAMTVDDAVALLDLGDQPFVFFLDPETRRGSVAYRRYDGHYGLVTSAEPNGG
jgi:ribosome-associated translation inhibitor RaiA